MLQIIITTLFNSTQLNCKLHIRHSYPPLLCIKWHIQCIISWQNVLMILNFTRFWQHFSVAHIFYIFIFIFIFICRLSINLCAKLNLCAKIALIIGNLGSQTVIHCWQPFAINDFQWLMPMNLQIFDAFLYIYLHLTFAHILIQ